MISFDHLVSRVCANDADADTDLLRRAYEFRPSSTRGSAALRRAVHHPSLEVAALVADMRLDDVAIAASLLHDVVEDTLTTIEHVRDLFGAEVATSRGRDEDQHHPVSSERGAAGRELPQDAAGDGRRRARHPRQAGDRLHNMRTLGHLKEERRIRIAQETLDIYAPIAHRLGMSKLKNELEELAFRHLDPAAFERLRAWVEERRRATEQTVAQLQATLDARLRESRVPAVTLEGRIKRLFSIREKLRRQKIGLDEVYDLIALRVITPTVRDCYAALGIIHQTWAPVPAASRTSSRCPARTATSRCTRRS